MQISAFYDSLGITTHIGSDPYNDPFKLDTMLDWIGFSNVRQNAAGNAEALKALQTLGALGNKIDLLINGNGPITLHAALQDINAVKSYLNAIEAPNEVNIWPVSYEGLTGIEAAISFQEDLYANIRKDTSLVSIPLYSFTLGGVLPSDVAGLTDLSEFSDYANIHTYAAAGVRPSWFIPASVDGMASIASQDPIVLTETGYYTLPGHKDWGGVSEAVQAKYSLTMAFENAMNGIARTYFYDLIDDTADPLGLDRESHFGFFRYDGDPKLVATAFHNLSIILGNENSSDSSRSTLSYSVENLPWTGGTMALEASNGRSFIALWNDVGLWDSTTSSEVVASPQQITVTLDETVEYARVYDPLLSMDALQSIDSTSAVTISLVDHPLLIEIAPRSASTTSVVDASTTTLQHTLTVALSEDRWQADATFIVFVNGEQIGDAQTVSALHGRMTPQEFEFKGTWDSSSLDVRVEFLNDAWGGSPEADRNLYVDFLMLDGHAYADTSWTLLSNSVASFSVGNQQMLLPRSEGVLNILVSGDFWLEAPRIAIMVDGVLQEGVHVITAKHQEGETQLISLQNSWGNGTHEIGVQLLNDAWGGTAETDRNAYLIGASYDQTVLTKASADLLNGAIFTFSTSDWEGDSVLIT